MLFTSSKTRTFRREGKPVPHWSWLSGVSASLALMAGVVTLFTLAHTGAPNFAALMTGIAWAALLPVAPTLPWARGERATVPGQGEANAPPQTLARMLRWWTSTRLQTLFTAILALLAILNYLSR